MPVWGFVCVCVWVYGCVYMIVWICLSVSESEFSSLMCVCYYPCLHHITTGKPDEKGKGLFWTGAKTFSHLINRGERKLFYQQKMGRGG